MEKEYIITYRSEEHFEVVGWVKAQSIEEAKETAKSVLAKDASFYGVTEAEIAEYGSSEIMNFED
jgi:predicted transcriptional regulator